jgi:hypothetical protein
MGYKTLRELEGINGDNRKNILELCGKEVLQSRLEHYVGRDIVVLTNPSFLRNGEITKGNFRGDVLEDVEFYGTENSNAHIWFKKGGFATGLADVYDVMFPNWTKKDLSQKLKIFNFYGLVGGRMESSNVFHVDAFSAYASLRHDKKESSDKQILKSVGLPKKGKVLR